MIKGNNKQQNTDEVIQEALSPTQFNVSKVQAHTHNGSDSVFVSYPNLTNRSRFINYRAVEKTTANTVANKVGGDFMLPFGGNFYSITAYVDTAGTTGSQTVVFLLNGVAIAPAVTIASGATISNTLTIESFTTKNFETQDILTINVTAIHTTPALGLSYSVRVTEITP